MNLMDCFTVGDGCWEWQRSLRNGYGQCAASFGTRQAHRAVYAALGGDIPEGLELDHLCRNPRCVRPSHLEPVTRRENARRTPYLAEKTQRTECPQGHLLDAANAYIKPNGTRRCRRCNTDQARERRRR